jgi:hypothetical protein
MPYILKDKRQRIDDTLRPGPGLPGELNYLITSRVLDWLGGNPNYNDFNAAIGALECVKLELYRRMVAPYEDQKCAENGDVYPVGGEPEPEPEPEPDPIPLVREDVGRFVRLRDGAVHRIQFHDQPYLAFPFCINGIYYAMTGKSTLGYTPDSKDVVAFVDPPTE